MHAALRIHPADDLIVALRNLNPGEVIQAGATGFAVTEAIPAKQKFAARDFAVDDCATMYGVTVGRATKPIRAGGLISTANLRHATNETAGKRRNIPWTPPDVSRWQGRTFEGYRRPHGRAGTANHWIVIPLVFCENRNLAFMREALQRELGYRLTGPYENLARRLAEMHRGGATRKQIEALTVDFESSGTPAPLFPHVDGVKFLEHGLGCGGTRQDAEALCSLLAGYIDHPNVAGATVLSLGCQHAQVTLLERELAKRNPRFAKPLHIFEQQKCASERDMMQQAIKTTFFGVAEANHKRCLLIQA